MSGLGTAAMSPKPYPSKPTPTTSKTSASVSFVLQTGQSAKSQAPISESGHSGWWNGSLSPSGRRKPTVRKVPVTADEGVASYMGTHSNGTWSMIRAISDRLSSTKSCQALRPIIGPPLPKQPPLKTRFSPRLARALLMSLLMHDRTG